MHTKSNVLDAEWPAQDALHALVGTSTKVKPLMTRRQTHLLRALAETRIKSSLEQFVMRR